MTSIWSISMFNPPWPPYDWLRAGRVTNQAPGWGLALESWGREALFLLGAEGT